MCKIDHICKRLLKRGASVLLALRGTLASPLHLAAEKGYTFVVKQLLDHKAPVIVTDGSGKMAVELAVLHSKDQAAALLVQRMQPTL